MLSFLSALTRTVRSNYRFIKFISLVSVAASLTLSVRAIERPTIWLKPSDRPTLLNKIENYEWAGSLFYRGRTLR